MHILGLILTPGKHSCRNDVRFGNLCFVSHSSGQYFLLAPGDVPTECTALDLWLATEPLSPYSVYKTYRDAVL